MFANDREISRKIGGKHWILIAQLGYFNLFYFMQCNRPPVGKKRSFAATGSNPKTVKPAERVREFPGEHLTVSGGKLFCKTCRESLGLKKSILASHINCAKHLHSK